MKFIRAYGEKKKVGITFEEPSLTKKSFANECDINKILKKYQKTGAIDHLNKNEVSYGFATSDDFTASMEIVQRGQTMFEELPSSIRTKFENDPAQFLDFVQDENNLEEMQELGLANKTTSNEIEQNPTPAKKGEAQIPEGDVKTEPPGAAKSGSE